MKESTSLRNVTNFEQLNDDSLVTELRRRFKEGRLTFLISEECRRQINALSLNEDNQLDHESASKLWQPLVENAITYLKRSDPREWPNSYGEPTSEDMNNLKAFGIEKLNNYFVQFKEFEKILYGAEKYYHEHTLHVLRVWILGTLILDDWFQNERKLPYVEFFDYISGKTSKPISDLISIQEIQSMWSIIALSHDLGYPLQKVDSINEQTRTMLRQYAKVNLQDLNFNVPQQHQFINDFILKFISSKTMVKEPELSKPENELRALLQDENLRVFRTHIQSKYYLKYSKSLENFEHGIFSSILLMKNLTYFLESDFDMDEVKPLDYKDSKQCAIRREILRAIACHTCEEIYHIRTDTLGFVLILCDELQSWGRPTFEQMRMFGSESPIARLRKFDTDELHYELELPGNQEELHEWTRGIFKRLHKVLRVAVDSPERVFHCLVILKSIESVPKEKYQLTFTSEKLKKPKCEFTVDSEIWEPWADKVGGISWSEWKKTHPA